LEVDKVVIITCHQLSFIESLTVDHSIWIGLIE
jgi:hypothetical protein